MRVRVRYMVSYRILSWGGWGEQDGSRTTIVCESPLRLLLMQSGTNFPNILLTHTYVQ